MANFVLVHGAWHGGWCWADTEAHLRAAGHLSYAPTLTGVGERSHLLNADITPDTHVADIANFIRWREMSDVILVGHSYGGMVISGAAGQVPEQIKALVYLDAFVPEQSDVSLFANANPARMAGFQKQIDAGAIALKPDLFDAWTDDPIKKDWLIAQCTPHPVECFTKGVTLTGREAEIADKHYILCARNTPSAFEPEYAKLDGRDGWHRHTIETKHDAMVDAPQQLALLLSDIAARSE